MRDVLIISDSHESATRVTETIEYRQSLLKKGEVLEVIFLGDGLDGVYSSRQYGNVVLYEVRGNCDHRVMLSPFGEVTPFSRVITLGGYKILLTHGHLFGVKSDLDELCREASRLDVDIVLYGHTHIKSLEYIKKGSVRGVDRDITLFNPGALSGYDGSFGNLSLSDNGFLLSHGSYSNVLKK